MFTGIVRGMGRVREVRTTARDMRITIETDLLTRFPVELGTSIACSGCCLTVVEFGSDWFAVEVSNETLDKTTLSHWQTGTVINLEPSLRFGDPMDGHMVLGHVDTTTEILSVSADGGSWRVRLKTPDAYRRFIAAKGSITLDGIALTVNDVAENDFGINIIPHTWDHTNISTLKTGDTMNLEVDPLARYVDRLLTGRSA